MSNPRHWLEFAEYGFLVVSILGTAIAAVSGQLIYVALPVSVSLLLSLVNRLRFDQQTKRRISAAMLNLEEKITEELLSLEEKVLDQLSQSKQPILPYSPTVQDTHSTASSQVPEEIAALQTQMRSCLSQLAAIQLQPLQQDIAVQKRLVTLLEDQCASLEKSLSNVIEYLNNHSSLPIKVSELEQGLGQISAAIAGIQKQINNAISSKINLNEGVRVTPVALPQPTEFKTQSPPTIPITLPHVPVKVVSPTPSPVQPIEPQAQSLPIAPLIKSQNWRLIHTLTGHAEWVRALAISPDGKTIVSGSFDKTIKLWRLPDGQLLNTLSEHSKGVFSVAITPDGQTLASGSWDQTIKLWEMETGKLIDTLTAHSASVRAIAIAPDGKTLVSGSFDATIKLWSINRRNLITTLSEAAGKVYAIAFSPDGQTLVSGGEDGMITLWQLEHRKQLAIFNGNADVTYLSSIVWSLVISPDGQVLACGSADGTIKLWHLSTHKLLNVFHGHSGQVMSIVISPDGQTLISGSADGTIKVWHLGTGEQLCTMTSLASASVVSVAICPQGNTLISGSVDGIISVWQQD